METERFPLYKREPKPNVITNGQFVADDNSVHPSAFNVVVTGAKNDVGSGTKSISILNSSGCIVAPNLHGVTLINTSGVTVTDSDVTYINGVLQSSIAGLNGQVLAVSSNYKLLVTDSTILCTTGASDLTISLESAGLQALFRFGYGKIYNIKKVDSGAGAVIIDPPFSETIDGSLTKSLTSQYDCVTIQTDGANWWII